MPVERNKDGSISIKSKNGVTAIGRIVAASDEKHEENFRKWVEECAALVTPGTHTFDETEKFFLEKCDALPIESNDRRMRSFKINVIMNHCREKLIYQTQEFSFDMTDDEIEKWNRDQNAMHEEAMNSTPERFGLSMRGYYLPHTEGNEVFYNEAYIEINKHVENHNHKQFEMQDICFFFEETTEHIQTSGGGNSLMQQLIIFRGISEEDIINRSPRFLGYISTLRDIGNLPDFPRNEVTLGGGN